MSQTMQLGSSSTIRATLVRRLYLGSNGWGVYHLQDYGSGNVFTAVGATGELREDCAYSVSGVWESDPRRGGIQLRVTSARVCVVITARMSPDELLQEITSRGLSVTPCADTIRVGTPPRWTYDLQSLGLPRWLAVAIDENSKELREAIDPGFKLRQAQKFADWEREAALAEEAKKGAGKAAWVAFRDGQLSARPVCEICKAAKSEVLHHLHYKTVGEERPFDVVAACHACHALQHPGKTRRRQQSAAVAPDRSAELEIIRLEQGENAARRLPVCAWSKAGVTNKLDACPANCKQGLASRCEHSGGGTPRVCVHETAVKQLLSNLICPTESVHP